MTVNIKTKAGTQKIAVKNVICLRDMGEWQIQTQQVLSENKKDIICPRTSREMNLCTRERGERPIGVCVREKGGSESECVSLSHTHCLCVCEREKDDSEGGRGER